MPTLRVRLFDTDTQEQFATVEFELSLSANRRTAQNVLADLFEYVPQNLEHQLGTTDTLDRLLRLHSGRNAEIALAVHRRTACDIKPKIECDEWRNKADLSGQCCQKVIQKLATHGFSPRLYDPQSFAEASQEIAKKLENLESLLGTIGLELGDRNKDAYIDKIRGLKGEIEEWRGKVEELQRKLDWYQARIDALEGENRNLETLLEESRRCKASGQETESESTLSSDLELIKKRNLGRLR